MGNSRETEKARLWERDNTQSTVWGKRNKNYSLLFILLVYLELYVLQITKMSDKTADQPFRS